MSTRQPRRTRRRMAPPVSLPANPAAQDVEAPVTSPRLARRTAALSTLREHHVQRDYSYVKSDLLTVSAVGAGVVAFIVAMSFLL